jgi:signal transduction histidine kinase
MERYRASIWRQENLAAMGRLTAGIAHEIRNPLGIIKGSAEHLRDRLQEVGLQDEVVAFIPDEVDRLDRILKGYLAFGTDSEPDLEVMDIRKPIRRTINLLAEEFGALGVEITLQGGESEHLVRADSHRLQQVLMNLLLNARDAMPNGGRVTLNLDRQQDRVVLQVIDEGSGLKGLSEQKLFSPFWTDKEKGSGLGLTLARRIVELHHGILRIYDRPKGEGAVAELTLPALSKGKRET